jgi:hypothetical protein
MALYYLSDQLAAELGKRKGKRKETIKKLFKKKGRLKKYGLAPARASFLLLVSINFLGLAKKFDMAIQKNETKVRNWWEKWGGNYGKLLKAIEKGKNKKIFKSKKRLGETLSDSELTGELGLSVAAAISSATPLLVAVKKLFKALDIKLIGKKKIKEQPEEEQEQSQDEQSEEEQEQSQEEQPEEEQEQSQEEEPEQLPEEIKNERI